MHRIQRSIWPVVALLALLAGGRTAAHAQDRPAAEPDTLSAVEERPISPRGAFLRSLVLPGWGQSYVGAPGRGALYFAMEAGSLWMTYKTYVSLRSARAQQRFLPEPGPGRDRPRTLVELREAQMEDWITLSLFLLLFSGADAYVAAHLADFDERVQVGPAQDGGVRLEARVPIGGRR